MSLRCCICKFMSRNKKDFSLKISCPNSNTSGLVCKKSSCTKLAYENMNPHGINELHEQKVDCKCECGYDPTTQLTHKQCSARSALRNHVTFPSVQMMPQVFNSNWIYFTKTQTLKRHWGVILQLNEMFQRDEHHDVWSIVDIRGQTGLCTIIKDEEQPKTFSFTDLQPGRTLIALYVKKGFNDFQIMLHDMNFDAVNVFKAPMKFVYEEASKLLNDADAKANGEDSACFGCGTKSNSLLICDSCNLAKYCSKV